MEDSGKSSKMLPLFALNICKSADISQLDKSVSLQEFQI